MSSYSKLDTQDPLAKSIRGWKHTLIRLVILVTVMLLVSLRIGVPHIQVTYEYANHGQGYIRAEDRLKLSGVYYGPLGRNDSKQANIQTPLTIVKFLPLRTCFGF